MPRVRMIAFLLILGGTVFGVLGALHAVYTVLDLRNPQLLVPADFWAKQICYGNSTSRAALATLD